MKAKGFTLIELLAVIVILAIIALIATPIVLGIIEDTKKSAQLRSAEMYLDGVEQAIMKENMNNDGNFKPSSCNITKEGNVYCPVEDVLLEIEVDGEKPKDGNITFEEGKIKEVTLNYTNSTIVKNEEGNLVYSDEESDSGSEEEETLAPGLYKTDGTFISWDDLTSTDYQAITYYESAEAWDRGEEPITTSILTVSNGELRTAFGYDDEESEDQNCSNKYLTGALVIPNSVTSIERAFRHCTNLTSVIIPNSVTSIGQDAFWGCTGLTSIGPVGSGASVEIPNSVTIIGSNAFSSTGLTSIVIPDSVKSIESGAFAVCTDLTSVTIPDSVTSIGVSAFCECESLTSITIPDSVTSIGDEAFAACGNLTTIYYSGIATGAPWGAYSAIIKPYSEAPTELLP